MSANPITVIYEEIRADGRRIGIVIPGTHDVESQDFDPFRHEHIVMVRYENEVYTHLSDEVAAHEVLERGMIALHVYFAVPATSQHSIVRIGNVLRIRLQEYGETAITIIGRIELPDELELGTDIFLIGMANPERHVHLLVIIEIVDVTTGQSRAIDLDDISLITMVRARLALDLGLIDEESLDDVRDEDEDTIDSSDTVVQRQCWTTDPEN